MPCRLGSDETTDAIRCSWTRKIEKDWA